LAITIIVTVPLTKEGTWHADRKCEQPSVHYMQRREGPRVASDDQAMLYALSFALQNVLKKTTEKLEKTTEKLEKTTEKLEKTTENLEKITEKLEKVTENLEKTTEKLEKTTEKLEKIT